MSRLDKKAKMDDMSWENEFDAVRQYILQSPFPSDHPAIIAALNGIDQEVKRRYRDSKLHQKFASTSDTAVNNNVVIGGDVEIDAVKVEVPSNEGLLKPEPNFNSEEDANVMTDDWQDIVVEDDMIGMSKDKDIDENYETSPVGAMMAKKVVSFLASNNVLCGSPTAALAVAFHAVLLQSDFICTGVPETVTKGGFAAPIRDLPMGQFLPLNWDVVSNSEIKLRYRHRKVAGSCILSTTHIASDSEMNGATIQVSLNGSPIFLSELDPFLFFVSDHINLNSWSMAQKGNAKVSPVLHYKALAPLLSRFIQYFNLETAHEDGNTEGSQDHFASHYLNAGTTKCATTRIVHPVGMPNLSRASRFGIASEIPNPGQPIGGPLQGDFDGDLRPIGIDPPSGDGSLFSGNLMGPNHPIFSGGKVGAGPSSKYDPPDFGLGMKPRFDPFGPPGGPTEPPTDPYNQFPAVPYPHDVFPPGGTGNPNNDLAQPPPSAIPDPQNVIPPGGTGNPNNDLAQPPPFGKNNMFL